MPVVAAPTKRAARRTGLLTERDSNRVTSVSSRTGKTSARTRTLKNDLSQAENTVGEGYCSTDSTTTKLTDAAKSSLDVHHDNVDMDDDEPDESSHNEVRSTISAC